MENLEIIEEKIKLLKSKINKILNTNDIISINEIINISQELDQLLDLYDNIKNKNN